MDFMNILPSDNMLWGQVWKLYNESFPEEEKRRISSHVLAAEDPDFHGTVVVDNGEIAALLFYWEAGDFIYIEHLAVNPRMRGKNFGTSLMKQFIAENPQKMIILEIDPPVDDISIRRLGFYRRIGFTETGYKYMHPSYRRESAPHELWILSYPEALDEEQYRKFQQYLTDRVLKYTEEKTRP